MQVLRKLGHISQDDVVLLKGQAACEIDTADELLTTELMFNGTFNNLDKHQLVALVSCLVPVEKSNVRRIVPSRLDSLHFASVRLSCAETSLLLCVSRKVVLPRHWQGADHRLPSRDRLADAPAGNISLYGLPSAAHHARLRALKC